MSVMQEAKAVAAKKRRGSSRLENLGIPEEELLRQQQELFAKVKHIAFLKFFSERYIYYILENYGTL